MSEFWDYLKKIFVGSWDGFSCFFNAIIGYISRRGIEPKPILVHGQNREHDHDDFRVRFTPSIAESPSVHPPGPKVGRRPTTGKGLNSSSSDDYNSSDDEDLFEPYSVEPLASSSSFVINFDRERMKTAVLQASNSGFSTASNSRHDTQRKVDFNLGGQRIRISERSRTKLVHFIQKLPNANRKDFKSAYKAIRKEVPALKKFKSDKVFEIITKDLPALKNMPVDDACDNLLEKLYSIQGIDKL